MKNVEIDLKLDLPKHIKYWKRCSTLLPADYTAGDGSRMSFGFFIIAALDLLGQLETISVEERNSWIDWIYSCQVYPGGFRGFTGANLGPSRNPENWHWDPANLPNTYFALASLLILGDDFARLRRTECLQWLARMQTENGSFGEILGENGMVEGGNDMRLCCCAAGISFILQSKTEDFKRPIFDESKLLGYIASCESYEGGYAQAPLREPHSGLNYCAYAAMSFITRLRESQISEEDVAKQLVMSYPNAIHWMLDRQTTWVEDPDSEEDDDSIEDVIQTTNPTLSSHPLIAGFNGRCGKMSDTCYCFWNIGALMIIQKQQLVNQEAVRLYLLTKVQHMVGGFGKEPGHPPDILHSYLGLAVLSIFNDTGLKSFDPTLCFSKQASLNLENTIWQKNR